MTIAFIVPGQPQGKGRARIVRIGAFNRLATPKQTVAYEGLIAHATAEAMGGRAMLTGPVSVALSIECLVPASWSGKKQRQALAGEVMPTSKPDIDNVVKAVFDGMNGVLWRDDVLVVDLRVRKRFSTTPCVRVSVALLHEPEQQSLVVSRDTDPFAEFEEAA